MAGRYRAWRVSHARHSMRTEGGTEMEYNDEARKRLRRVEGQIRGVIAMMDAGEHCKDVVSQLKAARNAVDKTIAHIVAVNLEQCIIAEKESEPNRNKLIEEAMQLLVNSR